MKKADLIDKIIDLNKGSVGDFSEYAQLAEETLLELIKDGEKYLTTEGLKFILKNWKDVARQVDDSETYRNPKSR